MTDYNVPISTSEVNIIDISPKIPAKPTIKQLFVKHLPHLLIPKIKPITEMKAALVRSNIITLKGRSYDIIVSTKSENSILDVLPTEIILEILSHLFDRSLASFICTCKASSKLRNEGAYRNAIWRKYKSPIFDKCDDSLGLYNLLYVYCRQSDSGLRRAISVGRYDLFTVLAKHRIVSLRSEAKTEGENQLGDVPPWRTSPSGEDPDLSVGLVPRRGKDGVDSQSEVVVADSSSWMNESISQILDMLSDMYQNDGSNYAIIVRIMEDIHTSLNASEREILYNCDYRKKNKLVSLIAFLQYDNLLESSEESRTNEGEFGTPSKTKIPSPEKIFDIEDSDRAIDLLTFYEKFAPEMMTPEIYSILFTSSFTAQRFDLVDMIYDKLAANHNTIVNAIWTLQQFKYVNSKQQLTTAELIRIFRRISGSINTHFNTHFNTPGWIVPIEMMMERLRDEGATIPEGMVPGLISVCLRNGERGIKLLSLYSEAFIRSETKYHFCTEICKMTFPTKYLRLGLENDIPVSINTHTCSIHAYSNYALLLAYADRYPHFRGGHSRPSLLNFLQIGIRYDNTSLVEHGMSRRTEKAINNIARNTTLMNTAIRYGSVHSLRILVQKFSTAPELGSKAIEWSKIHKRLEIVINKFSRRQSGLYTHYLERLPLMMDALIDLLVVSFRRKIMLRVLAEAEMLPVPKLVVRWAESGLRSVPSAGESAPTLADPISTLTF